MILIYCTKTSPRIEYVFDHILKLTLHQKFYITNSKPEFIDFKGYKFSYASAPVSNELFFQSYGLLEETGLDNLIIKTFEWENIKCFFKVGKKSAIPFDIFSAIFFLLSRYEEYMPHSSDNLSHFRYHESFAYKENFLETPIIDIWIEKLVSVLKNKINLKCKINSNNQKASIIISSLHTYKYTNKYPFESYMIWFKNLINLNLWEVIEHFFVLLKIIPDPWEIDNQVKNLLISLKTKVLFFFPFSSNSFFNNETPKTNEYFKTYIKDFFDIFKIGLLPSNNAIKKLKTFELENSNISNLVHTKINGILLKEGLNKISEDYKNLISMDEATDFSMGYIDAFGYRASTCTSFFFYDLSSETKTSLTVTPFCAHQRLIESTELNKVIDKIQNFNEISKKYSGCFSIILNNEIFEKSVKNSKRRSHFMSVIETLSNLI